MHIRSRRADTAELTIIVPVLNERDSVAEFYARASANGYAPALIFVDNASTDGTVEMLERLPEARVIRHPRNLGYGTSIRDGLSATDSRKVVIIDADLEYPPEVIPRLIDALDHDAAVYASRFLSPPAPAMPLLRRIGNRIVSQVFNLLFRQNTTDFYTGMKGLRREAINRLNLSQDGFEHVVEMGVQLARAGIRIAEIPVPYCPRSRGVSKMRHLPEMLKYAWYVTRYRLGLDLRGKSQDGAAK